MRRQETTANLLLGLTALIWGLAFTAQRMGMDFMGPLTFNGIRFLLGGLTLIPLAWGLGERTLPALWMLRRGMVLGVVLFLGAWLQQLGICWTTAGNAGFITGLYVLLVPVLGYPFGQRAGLGTWTGACLALTGMYLLSVTEGFSMNRGDVFVLFSAVFWAVHVLAIGRFSTGLRAGEAVVLSIIQFLTCGLISLAGALATETVALGGIRQGIVPILYGGLGSVGVAYTLQVIAQRHARPAPAAIILSLEAVFAALGGWAILGETMTLRAMFGCVLMLTGTITAQLRP
ncbi:MAG: hypothetical protein JG774_185 [Desulfomicrobiaceae bacterium]|jgi:drug/metabolite transporter (DMT)-like permease|nr:hypothetical protein [Desulfomicrobiaceae bacterium]